MTNNKELIGETKEDVVAELGDCFNFHPSDEWTYFLKRNFWGINSFLVLRFENNVVIERKIIKTFKNKPN